MASLARKRKAKERPLRASQETPNKSLDSSDKRTAARKALKRAIREAKVKWLKKQIQLMDRQHLLFKERIIAEQCYRSDKSLDNSDKRQATRKSLKWATREAKDKWLKKRMDRLLPLIEERNVAEQCYRSDKSLDNSDKRTAARKVLKQAIRECLEKQTEQMEGINDDPLQAWRAMEKSHSEARRAPRLVCKDGLIATTEHKFFSLNIAISNSKCVGRITGSHCCAGDH